MERHKDVGLLLDIIAAEHGNRVRYAMVPLQSGVGELQINAYPTVGEADVRVFNLSDGLTPTVRKSIRDWFEPLARRG